MWQDWAIAGAQSVFIISLIPSIVSKDQKPALSTCALTFVAGCVLVYAFATLGLWSAVLTTTLLNIEWGILGVQRYRLNKQVLELKTHA